MSLAEAGELRLERVDTDPERLAQAVVSRFQRQAIARNIALSVAGDQALPTISVDAQRIEQVLGNLLSNALRHTPNGGQVICRLQRAPGAPQAIEFSVADSGPGIPVEALTRVFDRFYRVDRGRARADGGTGLGLAIVKQLVKTHGGSVRADNLPTGGAVVTFSLPVRQDGCSGR